MVHHYIGVYCQWLPARNNFKTMVNRCGPILWPPRWLDTTFFFGVCQRQDSTKAMVPSPLFQSVHRFFSVWIKWKWLVQNFTGIVCMYKFCTLCGSHRYTGYHKNIVTTLRKNTIMIIVEKNTYWLTEVSLYKNFLCLTSYVIR